MDKAQRTDKPNRAVSAGMVLAGLAIVAASALVIVDATAGLSNPFAQAA